MYDRSLQQQLDHLRYEHRRVLREPSYANGGHFTSSERKMILAHLNKQIKKLEALR